MSTGHHVTPLLHGTPTGQDVAVKCHCWWVRLQCCRTRSWWKDKPATTGLTSARQPDATSLQTSSLKVAAIWITSLPSASQRSTRLILCREVTLLSEPCPPSLLLPLATTRPYHCVIVQPGPQLLVELIRCWTDDAEAVPSAEHSGIGEETLLLRLVPERRQAATPAPSVGIFALSLTS
jgi:hypothetical protein